MWQPVLMINGFIMLVLGIMMMVPATAQYYYTGSYDMLFVQSGIIAIFLGGALFLANYGKIKKISILQGYLITIFSWFLTPVICALPLINNGSIHTFHDAVFEATAGITTAGATILSDVEAQSKSLLLWRSMLNGLGGVGIVIFAVALSPFLGTGGMHLFSKENSDTEDKFLPKISYIANDIILMYIVLNICCAALLKFFGMNWFDAVTWALSTISTGGFSIKNNSISYYNSATIETIVACFMLLGALPITYFILLFKRRNIEALKGNSQVNTFLKLVCFYIVVLSGYYAYQHDVSYLKALRVVGFNLIAALSTAGIFSADFLSWGSWSVILFLFLFLHGGCTGSTTGSIKMFRWQVVSAFLKQHIIKSLSPHQVAVMKVGDKVIDNNIASSVFALILGFIFAILFFTAVLSFSGLDFMTALGAVVGNITGVGSGFTTEIGPRGNFSEFSSFVKYILSFVMVLGRLEVITVIVLLGKIRWR